MVLAEAHWRETEMYRHGQPFCPSFDRYNSYDKAGWLVQYTARSEGKLVGYATMYLTPSQHTQLPIATEDTFFLLPDYRQGRNAIRFYQFLEADLWSRGAVEIMMTVKLTNGAGRVLEYLGFTETAKQYTKQITEKFKR